MDKELSGAINQLLNYKDKLTKEYYTLCGNSGASFEVLNPKCLLVIGKASSLTADQLATFEIYRNSLHTVTIVTFDELLMKVNDMITVFSGNQSEPENQIEEIEDDDDLPF